MSRIVSIDGIKESMPKPVNYQVWLDFDGTITTQDVIDELLRNYSVNDSWKLIEQQWQAGLIGSRQCLEEQLDLIRISQQELNSLLNRIELDTGFSSLLSLLEKYNVPVAILSDSIDVFIRHILQRHGIPEIPFRSNTMVRQHQKIKLQCPYTSPKDDCKAAHCKCDSIKAIGVAKRKSIYIGDGLSDLCPAEKADLVFAKGALAESLEKNAVKFIPYSNLNEVTQFLRETWAGGEFATRYHVLAKTAVK